MLDSLDPGCKVSPLVRSIDVTLQPDPTVPLSVDVIGIRWWIEVLSRLWRCHNPMCTVLWMKTYPILSCILAYNGIVLWKHYSRQIRGELFANDRCRPQECLVKRRKPRQLMENMIISAFPPFSVSFVPPDLSPLALPFCDILPAAEPSGGERNSDQIFHFLSYLLNMESKTFWSCSPPIVNNHLHGPL